MNTDDAIPAAAPMLRGNRVYRIHWVLDTDRLLAVCFCGAERIFEDPIELWEWLLAHPDGHDSRTAAASTDGDGSSSQMPPTASRSTDFIPA